MNKDNKSEVRKEAFMLLKESMHLGYDFENDVVVASMKGGPGDDYVEYEAYMKFSGGSLCLIKDIWTMQEHRFDTEYNYPITFSANEVDIETFVIGLIAKCQCEKIMCSSEYSDEYDPEGKIRIVSF